VFLLYSLHYYKLYHLKLSHLKLRLDRVGSFEAKLTEPYYRITTNKIVTMSKRRDKNTIVTKLFIAIIDKWIPAALKGLTIACIILLILAAFWILS